MGEEVSLRQACSRQPRGKWGTKKGVLERACEGKKKGGGGDVRVQLPSEGGEKEAREVLPPSSAGWNTNLTVPWR